MLLPIPVKPYVRHLLIKHYGKEPIPIRANTDIGQIFLLAVLRKAYLNLNFKWRGQLLYELDDCEKQLVLNEIVDDLNNPMDDDGLPPGKGKNRAKGGELEIEMPADCVELKFLVGGKFERGVILPDMLEQIGKALESYARIYAKGFSHGARCYFNSSRNSAIIMHQLFEFQEDTLTRDNLDKIIQRENNEMKDPIEATGLPRKSFRFVGGG